MKNETLKDWFTIVLASASPRRAALLQEIGMAFETVPGQIEETAADYLSPVELALLNARNKAQAVAVSDRGFAVAVAGHA